MKSVVIKICKENIHFTAAHFTIFSPTSRERVHGHDYFIKAAVSCYVNESTGMCFDYAILKHFLKQLAESVDEYFLLPGLSSIMPLKTVGDNVEFVFNQQAFSLPSTDVKILPVTNISNESLAAWFLEELLKIWRPLPQDIFLIDLEVENGRGQSISSQWSKA
jgi:6-pyruvoyltetrahydropterin/6-carboxytetrahydropterin synthase